VRCPEYRRALVLQPDTELFLDDRSERVDRLAHLDNVLVWLMRPAAAGDLAKVSNALVRSGLKLPKAIHELVRHRDPSVALPVLKHTALAKPRPRSTDLGMASHNGN
jgi:hypothetical protein